MVKRFLKWLVQRRVRTFVFGENQVAVMTGTVNGSPAVILCQASDPHLKHIVGENLAEGFMDQFKDPVVLKFPSHIKAALVAAALCKNCEQLEEDTHGT